MIKRNSFHGPWIYIKLNSGKSYGGKGSLWFIFFKIVFVLKDMNNKKNMENMFGFFFFLILKNKKNIKNT